MFGTHIEIPDNIRKKINTACRHHKPAKSSWELVHHVGMRLNGAQPHTRIFFLADKMRTRISRKRLMECLATVGGVEMQKAYLQHELRSIFKHRL